MPEISVIVPVYNVEQYLNRCVDSILAQTYRDYELILVNDGSTDNSGSICEEYAKKDSRIRVFHKENGGQSSARNMALDWVFANSDSQWIHFVDSDDWIHPQMLELLRKAVLENDVKIGAVGHFDTHGITPGVDTTACGFELYTPEEYYNSRNMNAVMPVAKLYHKNCFSDIRYPVGKIHEDAATSFRLLFAEKKIAVSDAALYYYFQNPEGTTKSPWSLKRLDAIDAVKAQISFFKEAGYKKAYEHATIGYASVIIHSREHLQKSDLPSNVKRKYTVYLNALLTGAFFRYGLIYLRLNVGIFVDAFPKLAQVYKKIKVLCQKMKGK